MTRDEAAEMLGVAIDADRKTILAAHRRLMQKLHPDRGGTDYLAARLNEARDRLLEGD
jgi:curved DNA-binding protein CbpA